MKLKCIKNYKSHKSTTQATNIELPIIDIDEPQLVSEKLLEIIPNKLSSIVELFPNNTERSIALLSSLPLIASTFRNVKIKSDGKITPDLYITISGPPGSGKSAANKMRDIVSSTEEFLRLQSNTHKNIKSLFISANTSKRGLYNKLKENDGRGLIFDTEIDPLVSASKQEWGDFTDIMRKAFEHQPIDLNRSEESIFIDNPMLSICLTGTHGQLKGLFNSTGDGNFSRFAHFTYFTRPSFKSSNPKNNNTFEIKSKCSSLSNYLSDLHLRLKAFDKEYLIEITDEQWIMIDKVKKHFYDRAIEGFYDQNLIASINRINVIAVRMASIFHMIEYTEKSSGKIQDKYLKAALWITQICLASSNELIEILPTKNSFRGKTKSCKDFHHSLPEKFKREEAVEIGKTIPVAKSTVGKYLTQLVEAGIIKRAEYGFYTKI